MNKTSIVWFSLLCVCICLITAGAENMVEKKIYETGYTVMQDQISYQGQEELIMQLKQARKNHNPARVAEIQKKIADLTGHRMKPPVIDEAKPTEEFRVIPGNTRRENKCFPLWGNDVVVAASSDHEINCYLASSLDGSFLYASMELWQGNADPDNIRISFSTDHGQSGWISNSIIFDESFPLGFPCNVVALDSVYIAFNRYYSSTDTDLHMARSEIGSLDAQLYLIDNSGNDTYQPYITTDLVDHPGYYWLYVTAADVTTGECNFYRSVNNGVSWDYQAIGPLSTSPELTFTSIAYAENSELLHAVFTGPDNKIWYTRSIDLGDFWSTPMPISNLPNLEFMPQVAAKGDFVIVVYVYFYNTTDLDILYSYSQDGGLTWSIDNVIAGSGIMEMFPSVSIDLGGGTQMYASYQRDDDGNCYVMHADIGSPTSWSPDGFINDGPCVLYESRPVVAATFDPVGNNGVGAVWLHEYSATDYDVYYDASWVMGIEEENGYIAEDQTTKLHQNRPNPFDHETYISYSIPSAGNAGLRVYDIQGRLIKEIFNEQKNPGSYTVFWNGQDNKGNIVPNGVYFYRLTANDQMCTRTMTVCR
jgi:hypothetical protein